MSDATTICLPYSVSKKAIFSSLYFGIENIFINQTKQYPPSPITPPPLQTHTHKMHSGDDKTFLIDSEETPLPSEQVTLTQRTSLNVDVRPGITPTHISSWQCAYVRVAPRESGTSAYWPTYITRRHNENELLPNHWNDEAWKTVTPCQQEQQHKTMTESVVTPCRQVQQHGTVTTQAVTPCKTVTFV